MCTFSTIVCALYCFYYLCTVPKDKGKKSSSWTFVVYSDSNFIYYFKDVVNKYKWSGVLLYYL